MRGRELERLVAILEEALAPQGASVISPDFLRDAKTGELREVDVSVRAWPDGPLLAVVECRDRRSPADVTWVEQVITKVADLEGVRTAVLVSSSGFSAQALRKAGAYGIETRLVTSLEKEEVERWFRVGEVVCLEKVSTLEGIELTLHESEETEFAPDVRDSLAARGLEAEIFERPELGPVSPLGLWHEAARILTPRVWEDLPRDGGVTRLRLPMPFSEPAEMFSVRTSTLRRVPVAAVQFLVAFSQHETRVLPARFSAYGSEQARLAESVEIELPLATSRATLSLHKVRTADAGLLVRLRLPE